MRRIVLVPLVVGGILTGAVIAATITGYLWPIGTQVWSVLAPRPCNEADVIA